MYVATAIFFCKHHIDLRQCNDVTNYHKENMAACGEFKSKESRNKTTIIQTILNMERSYKREGRTPFEHFVGFLTVSLNSGCRRNSRAAEGERELPFIYPNRRLIDR